MLLKRFIFLFIIIILAANAVYASRWQNMPVKVYIEENPKEYIMKKAFNKWKSASNGLVRFEYVKSASMADIMLSLRRNLMAKQ